MDLRQLEYFVAVVEEANFTRAAQRVNISQSGVSSQIRQLEREVGAQLIDRSGRSATPTAAGEAALRHARAALAASRAVRDAVADIEGVVRGRLRIGMVSGCTITALFDALSDFRLGHPGVELSLQEGESSALLEQIRAGALDVGLAGIPERVPSDLDSLILSEERLIVLVPREHALAGRARIMCADLEAHALISMPLGTGIRSVLEESFKLAGLGASVTIQATSPRAIADLAERGLGVGVLSESMSAISPRLQPIEIADAPLKALLALVWSRDAGAATRVFVQNCRESFDLQ